MTDQSDHQGAISAAEAAAQYLAGSTIRTGSRSKATVTNSAVRTGLLSGAVGSTNLTPPGQRAAHAARIAFGGDTHQHEEKP